MSRLSASGRAWVFLALGLTAAIVAGLEFRAMHEPEPITAGPGVARMRALSDYAAWMKGSPGDTPVYVFEGREPGGTMLLLGGTHPQEISGLMAAVLAIENVTVAKGRLIVIPQANRSGFTHTEPLEGFPHTFEIDTPQGRRWFRLGMRLANPIHQWPDPDLHVHAASGEVMVGLESRNLNRNHPGQAEGRFTARVAAAILAVLKAEGADLTLDLHEAYPEYPIINMIVAHERAFEIATLATMSLQARKIPMDLMASPKNLHGLSHREFGDHSSTFALLSETANPGMGRFRGRTDEALVVEGQDANYVRASGLKRLFVPFSEKGHPLADRVARNMATIEELLAAHNEANTGREIVLEGLPDYDAVRLKGLGHFLKPIL
ncbi:MAG: succinylglutamate desuccinylase/aspartoacylase family protein [Rhodospirillales bacterium]|nr:succinylglutamate desuccinylase/aspartoacylase family protein [Rhodospirillales bacterium]